MPDDEGRVATHRWTPDEPCPSCGTTDEHDDDAGYGMLGCPAPAAGREATPATGREQTCVEYACGLAAAVRVTNAQGESWLHCDRCKDLLVSTCPPDKDHLRIEPLPATAREQR